jgi:DNA polymerase III alpha subunit
MLIAQIEDMSASVDVVVFAKLYATVQEFFVPDRILTIKGRLRFRERAGSTPGEETPVELSVSANEVTVFERPLHVAAPPPPRGWHVTISKREHVDRLAALLDEWPGEIPVVMHAGTKAQRMHRSISADARLRNELVRIFGNENVTEGAPEETIS